MAKEIINIDFNPESIIEFLTKIKNETPSAMEKMMKTARVFMKNTVNENFETEGKHTGDKWTGWSEKYKLKRPKGKILTLGGHLRKDIRAYSGSDKNGVYFAKVVANKEYAAIHNFGIIKNFES